MKDIESASRQAAVPCLAPKRPRRAEGGHPHPKQPGSCELKVNPAALRSRLSARSSPGAPAPADGSGQGGPRSHSPTAACCSSGGKAEAAAAAPSRRH